MTKHQVYQEAAKQEGVRSLLRSLKGSGFTVSSLVVRDGDGGVSVWDPRGEMDGEDIMSEYIINSRDSLHEVFGKLREQWEEDKYLRVKVTSGAHRSISLNALSHVWYGQIAKVTGETPEEVKSEYKLRLGVPILRAEDEDFRSLYDLSIKATLSYEQKLQAMKYLPVTSLMSQQQMKRYMDDLQGTALKDHGIQLEYPSDG